MVPGEYDVTLSLTYHRETVELTRRLFLGQLPEFPVVRPDDASDPLSRPLGPPRWMLFLAIGAAGISIVVLMALLVLQSRRLARARLSVGRATASRR